MDEKITVDWKNPVSAKLAKNKNKELTKKGYKVIKQKKLGEHKHLFTYSLNK